MKKILLVEDDALVAGIYRQKLAAAGFEVAVAEDGLTAIRQSPAFKPDLVVLDILLPKMSGLEVLKFLRQHAALTTVHVVVFSNVFLGQLWEQIATLGVDEMLLKSSVTPTELIQTISKVLSRPPTSPTPATAAPEGPPPAPSPAAAPPAVQTSEPVPQQESAAAFRERIRHEFFEQIPVIVKGFQQTCEEVLGIPDTTAQARRLEHLRRRISFITHMTSMAGCNRIAQLCGAFEVMLFDLQLNPTMLNDSSRHTIGATVTLLADCLRRAEQAGEQGLSPITVLVVDDDAVCTQALVVTLARANLQATAVPDPMQALERLRQNNYDVVLLDINLPGMSGLALCEQMRKLPRHAHTPVIFVTRYAEFEPRARAILGAGDDLISKPIIPVELTVKVIAHMLRQQMTRPAPTS